MTVQDRLKAIRDAQKKSQKEMAVSLGISPRTWQDYEGGVNVPGWKVLEGLAKLGYNVNWILTGEGVMWRESSGGWWSDKMKEIRGDLSIPEFVHKVRFGDPAEAIATIQAIEDGRMEADWSLMLVLITELGIDPRWMFDSSWPMKISDSPKATVQPIHGVDEKLLRAAIEAVEEYLQEVKGTLPPDKKAELVLLICKLHAGKTTIEKATVISLVKLAV